jgi:RNA ligase
MHHQFPVIKHIDDLLPHIEGREEFRVVDKGTYKVINYTFNAPDTFGKIDDPSFPYLVECRGIKFYPDGKIMARTLHKFFNYGEKAETKHENVQWDKVSHLETKLDGSMVHPALIDDKLVWMTKMGITHISEMINVWLSKISAEEAAKIEKFARKCIEVGLTPTFEFTSPANRIVVGYDETKLSLLKIRDLHDGTYIDVVTMLDLAADFEIEAVYTEFTSDKLIEKDIAKVADYEDDEGIVVVFTDGSCLKVKSDWYVRLHRAKDQMFREKNVLKLIAEDTIDDFYPLLDDSTQKQVQSYHDHVIHAVRNGAATLYAILYTRNKEGLSRKDTALRFLPNLAGVLRPVLWSVYDIEDIDSIDLVGSVMKHLSDIANSNTKTESIRDFLGGKKYSDFVNFGPGAQESF